jgi:hypothetical protein
MSAKVDELNKELDIACYVRDSALKILNNNFVVASVTFTNSGGVRSVNYSFCANRALQLKTGDLVLCNTKYGLSVGRVEYTRVMQDKEDISLVPNRWIIQKLVTQCTADKQEEALQKARDGAIANFEQAKNSVAHVTSMIQIQHELEQQEHKARAIIVQTNAQMFMNDIAEAVELSVAFASGKILVIPSLEELREEAKKAFS